MVLLLRVFLEAEAAGEKAFCSASASTTNFILRRPKTLVQMIKTGKIYYGEIEETGTASSYCF
jgi:hypothetical protein